MSVDLSSVISVVNWVLRQSPENRAYLCVRVSSEQYDALLAQYPHDFNSKQQNDRFYEVLIVCPGRWVNNIPDSGVVPK